MNPMNASALSNAAAITSVGMHVVSPEDERISSLELQLHACRGAMRGAGITRRDIGAVFTGRAPMSYTAMEWNMRIVNELKIVPKLSSEITVHGAGVLATWQYAAMAVANGLVDYALCCSGCMGRRWVDLVKVNAGVEADLQFEMPYGPTTPSLYALWGQRYMHEFDVDPADTARIAVENRKWALCHPDAAMRSKGEISVEDVLASRLIASPLRLLDCSSWYKGGGVGSAVIITSAERAAEADRPVYIAGFGQCTTHEWVTDRLGLRDIEPSIEPNLTTTGAKVAAADAYAMTGTGPADIDLVETSAPFTFLNMMVLEDLGFCEKGEGKYFVGDGGIDFDDGLPFNTNGGYLSFGQAANGMQMALEAVQQLRGEAPGRQIDDPHRALVHFHGGPNAAHSVVLLDNEGSTR
jgi:acetyl-CoA acetyltransferase